MGVQVRIVAYAPDEDTAAGACRAAYTRIAELEDVFSDYRPRSELSRLCAAAGGPPVPVSAELFEVLSRAQALAERTGGAFDVTCGPYVQLWRRARETGSLPPEGELSAARELVGWQRLRLDPVARTAQLQLPGMRLDLGAIAKGYALDHALCTLREHGVASALIEGGGEIVLGDPPPGRRGWRISLPYAPPGKRRVRLANRAVSASGDTEQYFEAGGERYSHIVDPRVGLRRGEPLVVTVIGPDAATSDSLATAACVLGRREGRRLLRSTDGVRGFFWRRDRWRERRGSPGGDGQP